MTMPAGNEPLPSDDPRVQRGACAVCNHGRTDPLHDPRIDGYHEWVRIRTLDGPTPPPETEPAR